MTDIEPLKKEYEKLLTQLSDPELISDWPKFEQLRKRKEKLEKIFEKEREIEKIKNSINESRTIISGREDSELVSLAETEIVQLQEKEKKIEEELGKLIEKKDDLEEPPQDKAREFGDQAAIIEIRAGTGGNEASLFAGDLFRMYSRYAQNQGWKLKVLDSNPTELGGFKEVIFEIDSPSTSLGASNIFEKMQYEGGVHRVQRIPETEKAGRVHTSTASVAVLPKPKKAEIKIKPDDLKVDFYCASGPGGQYVNKRQTAVRITHLPTGIVVTSQTERNQLQNKENALAILEVRILEKAMKLEEEKMSGKRKTQIGWAKRAEKIRTYNFPQDRLTDHRIKKNWHNLEKIMDGELNPVISVLQKQTD